MKVFVLGGDGFCGWPCSVNLADHGHDVLIIDNLSRRKIDIDLEVESLTPIRSIGERLKAWEEVGSKPIRFINLDVSKEYQRLLDLLIAERPDTIVHFAEQRAAPYSMKSSSKNDGCDFASWKIWPNTLNCHRLMLLAGK